MNVGVSVAMVAALLGFAFFNAAETAAFTLEPGDLDALRKRRPRTAAALDALFRDRRRVLVSVLLGNLLVSVLFFNLVQASATALSGAVRPVFEATALVAFIVLGEMAPKTVALRAPARFAERTAAPLGWVVRLLAVPGAAFAAAARGLRGMWRAREEEGDLAPAELASLLAVAAKRGALGEDEMGWLRELVLLAEVRVREVMTPRVEATAFDLAGTRDDFVALFRAAHRNKIPVFEGSVDRLTGWLDAKEVLGAPDRPLRDLVKPLGFTPESATAADALALLKRTGGRMLAVVDEYGGFEGLVTREDLVECVFGDLADETDQVTEAVRETAPGRFLVDAGLPVTESRRVFGFAGVAGGASTLGGLVLRTLKRLPRVGDEVRLGRTVVRVASVRGRTASKLWVRHVETPEASDDDADGGEARR
ncbi:MAG TPA: hemolysin family protein [Planctomycetota bacterium]|nr:hemolysin family protein [Planctomycetota bacterium]